MFEKINNFCASSRTVLSKTAKSFQSCPTLCNPIDGNPPGSLIPGILQARILEWVAISFSNAWKWKVKGKSLSRVRTLRDATDCSLPGSSVHGIFQARVLEWGAIAFSAGTAEETINTTKRQPSEWNYICKQGHQWGIHLQDIHTNSLCTSISRNNPQDFNGHLSKEDIEMAIKHTKRCSASVSIRERRIRNTMWYQLTQVRMVSVKKIYGDNCWREYGEKTTLLPIGGNES